MKPDDRVTHLDDRNFPAVRDVLDERGVPDLETAAWVVVIVSDAARTSTDLQSRIEDVSITADLRVAVVSIPWSRAQGRSSSRWCEKIRNEKVHAMIWCPGVSTWGGRGGQLRKDRAPHCRSARFPWGLPWRSGLLRRRVSEENKQAVCGIRMAAFCSSHGAVGGIVHLKHRRAPAASIWKTRLAARKATPRTWRFTDSGANMKNRDCALHLARATSLFSSDAATLIVSELIARCETQDAPNARWVGKFASPVVGQNLRVRRRRLLAAHRYKPRAPPPIHEKWFNAKEWRLCWRGRWKRVEHTNYQELRVIAAVLRRLSFQPQHWGKRILIFTDSLAALGAAHKGRSSAYPMLRICRTIAALGFALGLKVVARYVESERNLSDGPSRCLCIMVAGETKKAHQDRAAEQARRVDEVLQKSPSVSGSS